MTTALDDLRGRLSDRTAVVGVTGLGVGIPSDRVAALVSTGHLTAPADFGRVGEGVAPAVRVPRSPSERGERDLSAVSRAASTTRPPRDGPEKVVTA